MLRDLARELNDAVDEPTTIWEPEVGDTVIGCLRVRDKVSSKFTTTLRTRLILETDTGELVTIYCSHTVLEREITEQNPRIGDRVGIKRLLDVPGKNYRRYKVVVDHQEDHPVDDDGPPPDDTWTPEDENHDDDETVQ